MKRIMYVALALMFILSFDMNLACGEPHVHIMAPQSEVEYYYVYVDKGDSHDKIEYQKRPCTVEGCNYVSVTATGRTYVEGHVYALTNYSVHQGTQGFGFHTYSFICTKGNCNHVTTRRAECFGPPCEMVFYPQMLIQLLTE